MIGEDSVSSDMPLNPTECGSPTHTGISCRAFKQKIITAVTGDMHEDYYPGLNAIIIGGASIAATTEFNFYIPVFIKKGVLTYAFLTLI